jgi:hypothetical protein
MYKFQEGLKTPEQRKQEMEDAQYALDAWMRRPGADSLGMRGPDVDKYIPGISKPVGPQLTFPQYESPYQQKGPHLLDKPLELGSASTASPKADTEPKKKEETAVQRKAEPVLSPDASVADVDAAVNSSGRPLDVATRRSMESRMGFDFSKVRLHTD